MSEVLNVLGPSLEHLTELSDDKDYCMMKGEMASGVFVPIHRHADRETFFILSGEVEGWRGERWETFKAGDTIDIPGNLGHAWRNVSSEKVVILMTTETKLGKFYIDAGYPVDVVPVGGPPTQEAIKRFTNAVHDYGYWLAPSEENASIGL